MVYLLGTLANDADYMPSLLHALGHELGAPAEVAPGETWAAGYYADGRALIIQRPAEILSDRGPYELAPDVKSQIVLAVANAGPGKSRPPLYRFRRWLFGIAGDVTSLEGIRTKVQDGLPDFLKNEVGDGAAGAVAKSMFLAELHRAGHLDDPLVDKAALGKCMVRTIETIHSLTREVGADPIKAGFIASNGRTVLAHTAGVPLAWKLQVGLEGRPDGPPDPSMTDFKQVAAALKRFRAVVLAKPVGALRAGWTGIDDNRTIAVGRDLEIETMAP